MVNKSDNKIVNKVLNDKYTDNTFEWIKHLADYGNEYWYVCELKKALEYKDWIVEVNNPIKTGKGKEEIIKDYKLSITYVNG